VKKNKAFTLIELLVVIAIIALLIGILLPAIGKARDTAKNVLSQSRMRQLALGANSYAADNNDLLFSYGNRPRVNSRVEVDLSCAQDGSVMQVVRDDVDFAGAQQTAILRRVTGRCEGSPNEIEYNNDRLWHRRWSHVILLDYLTTTQPEPIAASPFDKNQLDWQADQLEFRQGSTVPYANGTPNGVDADGRWNNDGVRQRWAFASSYQTVPAHWNSDGINTPTYHPVADTPHLFRSNGGQGVNFVRLGGRKFSQVAFPAGKVFQFEEFDRLGNRQGLAWMYPQAQCNLSFYDGSVRRLASSEANPGWNPDQPDQAWLQTYLPLDTFPGTVGDPNARYCQRYRWTRHGLRGVDYGGKEVGLPQNLRPQESIECVD